MVYTKKRTFKKKPTSWYNKKYSAKDIALKALANTTYLKGLVNSEMMHVVQSGTVNLGNSGTPTVLHLTAIAQGDGTASRTGNSILLRGIQCRFEFVNNSSATATAYRVMLVQDTQTVSDESTLTSTDILESASTLSFISTTTSGRFKILKNWYFTTDANSKVSRSLTYFKDMHQHIRYNSTASTDIQKNAIFLMAFSDQPTNTPSFSYNTKLNYHDN